MWNILSNILRRPQNKQRPESNSTEDVENDKSQAQNKQQTVRNSTEEIEKDKSKAQNKPQTVRNLTENFENDKSPAQTKQQTLKNSTEEIKKDKSQAQNKPRSVRNFIEDFDENDKSQAQNKQLTVRNSTEVIGKDKTQAQNKPRIVRNSTEDDENDKSQTQNKQLTVRNSTEVIEKDKTQAQNKPRIVRNSTEDDENNKSQTQNKQQTVRNSTEVIEKNKIQAQNKPRIVRNSTEDDENDKSQTQNKQQTVRNSTKDNGNNKSQAYIKLRKAYLKLIKAVESGDAFEAEKALEKGASANSCMAWTAQKTSFNTTSEGNYKAIPLLTVAAMKGDNDIVQHLLTYGAETEKRGEFKATPLMVAVERGHSQIVLMMLKKKANPNATAAFNPRDFNKASSPPMQPASNEATSQPMQPGQVDDRNQVNQQLLAIMPPGAREGENHVSSSQTDKIPTAIIQASKFGHFRVTPLAVAVIGGFEEVVNHLLDHGANVNSRDPFTGGLPIHDASRLGHFKIVLVLHEHGSRLESVDYSGATPLHWAAYFGFDELSEWLVQEGAKITAVDKQGKTPIEWALLNNHITLAACLPTCEVRKKGRTSPTPSADSGSSQARSIARTQSWISSTSIGYPSYPEPSKETNKNTPLMEAVNEGDIGTLMQLLESEVEFDLEFLSMAQEIAQEKSNSLAIRLLERNIKKLKDGAPASSGGTAAPSKNQKSNINTLLMKVVEESDIEKLMDLKECADELDSKWVSMAREIAQEKGNVSVIKLLGNIEKNKKLKGGTPASSDGPSMPHGRPPAPPAPSQKTNKNTLLVKAVEEADIETLMDLVECADELDSKWVSMSQEIAQDKGNAALLRLLGNIEKKINKLKGGAPASSDGTPVSSQKTNKNTLLVKAVEEADLEKLMDLVECADELDSKWVSMAQEIAQEKENTAVIRLLGNVEKNIKKIKGGAPASSDGPSMPHGRPPAPPAPPAPSQKTNKNTLLLKAVEEADIGKLMDLAGCAYELDSQWVTMAQEIALKKENTAVITILGNVEKRVKELKGGAPASSDGSSMADRLKHQLSMHEENTSSGGTAGELHGSSFTTTQGETGLKAIALHDYEGDEEFNISFNEGDEITDILICENGWSQGKCNGLNGWFPSSYVELHS